MKRTFNFPIGGEVIQSEVITSSRRKWDASPEALDPSWNVRSICGLWIMANRLTIPRSLLRPGIGGRPFIASRGRTEGTGGS